MKNPNDDNALGLDEIRAALRQCRETLARIERGVRGLAHRKYLPPMIHSTELVQRIIATVSADALLDPETLLGKARPQHIAEARFILYRLVRDVGGYNPTEVGRVLRKDHGTILHGLKALENRLETEPALRERVARLHASLTNS
jgi:chromosomal replication initiation ATPase DnaA